MASNLSAGLKRAAAVKPGPISAKTNAMPPKRLEPGARTVLIGAHYQSEVRRALLMVQAHPKNDGRNLKQLLGEAINDLCAKYGQPQPYNGEE
jgi:hypothetical protein